MTTPELTAPEEECDECGYETEACECHEPCGADGCDDEECDRELCGSCGGHGWTDDRRRGAGATCLSCKGTGHGADDDDYDDYDYDEPEREASPEECDAAADRYFGGY